MSTADHIGDAACRIIARGRITRRWGEGPRHSREHVVLVRGPGDARHLVAAGHWWSAHPATEEDVSAIESLSRRGQLYNAAAVLAEALTS